MKKLRSFTTGIIVAGLMAAGATAYAQGPGGPAEHGRRMRHGGSMGDLPLGALSLTDEQRQQVREAGGRHREALQAAGQQLRQAMAAQHNAGQTLPVDENAIRATTEGLAASQTALAIERAQLRSEIFALLTPEQQEKAKQLHAERQTRMKTRQDQMQQRRQQRKQQG